MAEDIAALLAGAAKTNANFNFDEIPKAYWAGLEQAYKQRTRDAFQDPSLYNPDGSIDPAKALSQALRTGGLQGAESTSKIGDVAIQQQILGNTARSNERLFGDNPPSTSRDGVAVSAPPMSQPSRPPAAPAAPAPAPSPPPPRQPQQAAGPFSQFLTAQGVPPEQHGPEAQKIQMAMMQKTGRPFDTTVPLNMQDPNTREVLHAYALTRARPSPQSPAEPPPSPAVPGMGPGGAAAAIPPPQAPIPQITVRPQPQPAPIPQPQPQPIQPRPVQTIPFTPISPAVAAGIITPGELARFGSAEAVEKFYEQALAGGLTKTTAEAYQKKLDAIRHANQPTEDQKKAAASGQTLPAYHAAQQKEKTDQTLMKEVDIPTLNTGKEKSTAANEEIKTYHEAKNILNQPGGIIAGAGGDQVLAMAKIAGKYLGIPAAEQAANRTEAFRAIMSGGVLQTVKQLGAGSGITNADVKFASDMVGKNITLDENSIRRIINLSEKVARRKIADHNANVDRMVAANPALAERASIFRVEPAPLRITVGQKISVGDVFDGREYYGGPVNNEKSWSGPGAGPDTWRAR